MYQYYYKSSSNDPEKGLSEPKLCEENEISCKNLSKLNFIKPNLQFNSPSIKEDPQRFSRNESVSCKTRNDFSNNYDKSFTTEIKSIPRNQINAFKAFRNSTFRLVVNGASDQGLITNNSNNSNRFSTGKLGYSFNGSNNSGNARDTYIDKINKRIMLKKITELATPYNANSDRIQKPFQRIIPHPILDDQNFSILFNSTNSDRKTNNKNCLESENEDSMHIEIKSTKNNFDSRENMLEISNDLSKLENYENLLKKELQEIKQLKNDKLKSSNKLVLVLDSKNMPISGDLTIGKKFQPNNENSNSLNTSRLLEDFPKKSTEINIINKCSIETTENSKMKQNENIDTFNCLNQTGNYLKESNREMFSDSSKKEINKNKNQTTLISEIEVCVDEFQESFIPPKSICQIPLYFQYNGGKKFKFKLKYLSKFGQAQKAFCDRLNINSLLNVKFMTESGQIVSNSDTPSSLDLKPNDIIIVTRN